MMDPSKSVKAFLDFIRFAQEDYRMARQDVVETEDETQDLLHRIELGGDKYHDVAKLSLALRKTRQDRRDAKDEIKVLAPLIDWAEENKSVIKDLEQLLGTLRKEEEYVNSVRHYNDRTNVVEETLGR